MNTAGYRGTFLPLVPALAAAIIASVQIWLALSGGLSPWKGGGFGMFASVDHPSRRILHVEALQVDGAVVRVSLKERDEAFLTYPSLHAMRSVADAVPVAREVRVAVYRLRVDRRTARAGFERVAGTSTVRR